MIRVLIADDDEQLALALSDSVTAAGDLEVVGVCHDADSVVAAAATHHPDVILMDVKMPGGGVNATKRILEEHPGTAVVGLSAHEDQGTASQMLDAGASGYLVKGMPESEIVDALRRAARGQMSLPADLGGSTFRDLLAKLRASADAESALRSSEDRMRSLIDAMPDALVVVTPDGEIEVANAPTQRMFGYAPGELVGLSIQVLVPERFKVSHENLVNGFLHHPRSRPMGSGLMLSGRRRDGTEFPVDISLSHSRGPNGVSVLAAIRDISEMRDADEVQRKSDRLFRELLESAPDAMVAVDGRGRIQVVNGRMEALFGYSRSELVGMLVDNLVPDSLRAGHAGHRANYLRDPRPRPMGQGLELFGRRKDGSEFPLDISLSPVPTEDGPLVIAAVRDITDRRVAERRQAETQSVAERRRLTAHLVQAQEEERRKIAADIHDDSIQAMTATSLRLQQLRKHLTTDQQKEIVVRLDEAVRESITRLRRLMFDLRPATLDRTGIGPALRELLERTGTETGIDWTLDDKLVAEPPSDLRVELYRITQEALANVRKHARAKRVTVELKRVDNGFHVRVTDDGVGFDIPRDSVKPDHIGMVAMRERATIAGGWCKVESRPGHGAVVDIWLPDDTGDGDASSPDASPEAPDRGSGEARR